MKQANKNTKESLKTLNYQRIVARNIFLRINEGKMLALNAGL